MRRIHNLDTTDTMEKKRLIFYDDIVELPERFNVVFMYGMLGGLSLVLLFIADIPSADLRLWFPKTLPFVFTYSVYMIYRKFTEKKMYRLNTGFNQRVNLQIILEFIQDRNWYVFRQYHECIISITRLPYSKNKHNLNVIFIAEEKEIYVSIIMDRWFIDEATSFRHLIILWKLKRLIRDYTPRDHTYDAMEINYRKLNS